jgi:hypothetical protein
MGNTDIERLGFKKYSPYNYFDRIKINSNKIDMTDVEFDILGKISNGGLKLMKPNNSYNFLENTSVLEIPVHTIMNKHFKNYEFSSDESNTFLKDFKQLNDLQKEKLLNHLDNLNTKVIQEQTGGYSPHLTMKNTSKPLRGMSDTGEVKTMYPGIDYFFKNASRVREIPLHQDGGMEEDTQDNTTGQYTYNTFEPTNQELPEWYLQDTPDLDFDNDYNYDEPIDLDALEKQIKQKISYSPYSSNQDSQRKVDNQGNTYYANTAPNPNGKSVSIRNNTLLNFKYKPWMSDLGARAGEIAPEKDGTRFAAFDNIEDSTKVYKKLMRGSGYSNLTVKDGLKKYAAGTYPSSIYNKVSNILNKKIGDLSEAELNQLMKVQALHEDNTQYHNYYGK